MGIAEVVKETMLMMGFTFLVGMALAFLIKAMIGLFFFLDGKGISGLATQYRAISRSNRMEMARIRKAVKLMDGSPDTSLLNYVLEDRNTDPGRQQQKDLDRLASFHTGDRQAKAKKDEEMDRLYEFHHGEV